jgi:hypothetical protein
MKLELAKRCKPNPPDNHPGPIPEVSLPGQELLPPSFLPHLPFVAATFHTLTSQLELPQVINELPLKIVPSLDGDALAGVLVRAGFTSEGALAQVTFMSLQLSAQELVADSNGSDEIARVLMVAGVAHELMHVYQYIHGLFVDNQTGLISGPGEAIARLYAINTVSQMVDANLVDAAAGLDFLRTEITELESFYQALSNLS